MWQKLVLLSAVLLTFCACQKIDLNSEESAAQDGQVKVIFQISEIENLPFENTATRAVVSQLCSRFSLAVFQNGSKVKAINQTSDEAGFGSIAMSLSPGEYQLVAIAHNGLGNCSIVSTDKVTFQNNRLTDTFYYYGTLNVTEAMTEPLSLSRPVAMFRLKITDNMPSNVVQMKFYYTGGSSTFNAVSGFGCVNSRQTETFSIDASDYGKPSVFEVYTFPHEANDFLNMQITALDANGATVADETLENLFIQPNVITQHTCNFFGGATPSEDETKQDSVLLSQSFIVKDDGKWADTIYQ